jgi:hypothetical protein
MERATFKEKGTGNNGMARGMIKIGEKEEREREAEEREESTRVVSDAAKQAIG